MMYFRAIIAFLVLPGVVAGLVPALIVAGDTHRGSAWAIGFALLVLGLALLLWCVRDFFVSNRGTLAPWDPPKHLVVVGLYRFVRNPMYVGVLTIILGWSLVFGSAFLALYLAVLAIVFHFRVVLYEEPRLRRQFQMEYEAYAASVPRWLPRLKPGKDEHLT